MASLTLSRIAKGAGGIIAVLIMDVACVAGVRESRLLSNPLGIFGHTSCTADTGGGTNTTGLCFNELECIGSGGVIQGYCSPSTLGVCCVFWKKKCGRSVNQMVSYFSNPTYPLSDSQPVSCLLTIKTRPNICYVQLDYVDVAIGTTNGKCAYDSISLLRSEEGPSGRICGHKSGFSTLSRVTGGDELGLNVITQSPDYKWKIKISMIGCNRVPKDFSREPDCGMSGAIRADRNEYSRSTDILLDTTENSSPDPSPLVKRKRKVKRPRKARVKRRVESKVERRLEGNLKSKMESIENNKLEKRSRRESERVCKNPEYFQLCQFLHPAETQRRQMRYDFLVESHLVSRPHVSPLFRKQLTDQLYNPSFTAKPTFCKSKFRTIKPKVFGGFEAPINAFPWVVSLQYDGSHFCGGSLISSEWVLTAAHCPEFSTDKNFLQNLTVSLGDHNITSDRESVSISLRVTKVVFYPLYDQDGYDGDLALLRLEKPVIFSRNIRPVCLPINTIDTYEKQVGVAAGWGITEAGTQPDTLRFVELNIVPNVTCVANLGVVDVHITERMICTFKGPTGFETTCSGDSGGPLMVKRSGRYFLVGTTSFSLVDCESPFPNVFTRISAFLEWISVAMMDVGSSA